MAEGEYVDRQTSYDTAFDQLVADAFPSSEQGFGDWVAGAIGLDNASVAGRFVEGGDEFINTSLMNGTYIETRLGDDLAALQASTDPADQAKYQEILSHVRETGVNSRSEVLSLYQRVATPETFTAVVLSQAGISQEGIEGFVSTLGENEAVRDNLYSFIESMDSGAGLSGDLESLTERIQANAGLFQAMVDNPEGFMQVAGSDAFESIMTTVTQHVESGGTLDQEGMMGLVAGISLEDKAQMFMQIGGATEEQTAEFTANLQAAIEANPALEGVLNTAIANSMSEGATSGSNIFETLTSSAEVFAQFASTEAANTLLTSPDLIEGIITRAQEHGENLTLGDLRDIGIENTIYHEAGIFAATQGENLPPELMMFAGSGIDMMISQAKRMGDGTSASYMTDLLSNFRSILSSDGIGGFLGGMGNTPGFLAQAGGLTASRFGVDLGGDASFFAQLDQDYIFDGSNGYEAMGYQRVDYEAIGRNMANNVWDAEGNVREPTAETPPPAEVVSPT